MQSAGNPYQPKTSAKTIFRALALGFGVVVLLFLAGMAIWLVGATLMNHWLFFGIVLAMAAFSSTVLHRLWARVTGSDLFILNFAVNTIVMTLLLSDLYLGVNYFAADREEMPRQEATISRRYTKTRHRTRRVSRRVYAQGEPYKVYFLELQPVGDANITPGREIEVTKTLFDKCAKGDTATIAVGHGRLGLDIIDTHSIKLLHPRAKYGPRRRCRFVGTSGRKFRHGSESGSGEDSGSNSYPASGS